MSKEELELYDMVLNSEKSFDVNYKELAISLRAELKKTEDRIQKAIEYIWSTKYEWGDLDEDNEDFDIDVYKLLDILNGEK